MTLTPATPRPYLFYIMWHQETGYIHTSPMRNAREAIQIFPNHQLVYEGAFACSYARLIDAIAMRDLLNECAALPDGFTMFGVGEV